EIFEEETKTRRDDPARPGGGRKKRRKRGKWSRRLLTLLILALLWIGGLVAFVYLALPKSFVHVVARTDSIVVLTGGSGRLEEGFKLLAADRAEKLFISGVYRGVDVSELLQLSAQTPDEVACCVTLGYAATNTQENAIETREWALQERYRSIRLVTANYHMPRSAYEFRRAMPDLQIIEHPVSPERFLREDWWKNYGTSRLAAVEYTKFLLAYARGGAEDGWVWASATINRMMAE
ncbi:MAG: YdcF family protein, partial [Pseudomonadota bacterium]